MHGWICVISNRAIPKMIRICRSEFPDDITTRLDNNGGSPCPYELKYKVYLNNSFLILQNIRRVLLAQHKPSLDGWVPLSGPEAISLARKEIGRYIVDRFRMTIDSGEGQNDLPTMLRIMDSVLFLSENSFHVRNSIDEAREIAKVIAGIMRTESWMREGMWLNRVAGNNTRYLCRH